MTKTQIKSLDGLRGIAAFTVVLSHMNLFYNTDCRWLSIGDEAVALFFSLSGFLMSFLYGSRRLTTKAAADYLAHRFIRIYPIYFIAVCFVTTLSAIHSIGYFQPIAGATEILRHFAMLGSTGVFWSIPPEIQFYLFFLLLWLYLSDPYKYQIILVAVIALLCFGLYFEFPGPGILLTSKIHYFLFGAVAGRFYSSENRVQPRIEIGLGALALLGFFLLSRALFPQSFSFWRPASSLTAAFIIYLSACEAPVSRTLLGAAPLRFLGKISFSLYLFHVPVSFLFAKILPTPSNPWIGVAALVIASLISATVVHYTLEQPSRRLLLALWKKHTSRANSIEPLARAA